MGAAMPLRAWSDAQLRSVASALEPVWSQWLADWVGGDVDGEVACRHAADDADSERDAWMPLNGTCESPAWIAFARGRRATLEELLFGRTPTTPLSPASIAAHVADEAADHLCLTLRARLADVASPGVAPVASHFRAWGGSVTANLSAGGRCHAVLLFGADAADRLLPADAPRRTRSKAPPLAPLGRALANQPLRASVELAGCELTLGALAALRVGDVVPLPHGLDRAMELKVDGDVVCRGFLGAWRGAKAVELAPHAAAPAAHIEGISP